MHKKSMTVKYILQMMLHIETILLLEATDDVKSSHITLVIVEGVFVFEYCLSGP